MLRLSGLERQLESAGALILEGISAQKGKLPAEIEAALRRSVREAFSPQVLREAVLARLGAEIEPQQAEQALDWLRSPSGREITKLEEAASTVEGVRGLQAYAKSLQQTAPPPARLALVQRLDAVTGATEFGVDFSLAMALAVAVAVNAMNAAPMQLEALDQAIQSQRAQLRAMSNQAALASFLYTYREMPDVDLLRYLDFLESGAGAWYNRVTAGAVLGALKSSAMSLATALTRELENVQPKRSL